MGSAPSRQSRGIGEKHDANLDRVIPVPFFQSKDHVLAMLQAFSEFQGNQELCDMTLHISDAESKQEKVYHVHRFILAACSGYCKDKIAKCSVCTSDCGQDDRKTPDAVKSTVSSSEVAISVDFPVSVAVMDQVIRFLYTANLDMKVKDIPDLLEAAIRLKIPTLQSLCIWGLFNGFILEFFRPIIQLSDKLDIPDIREFTLRRTIEKFDEFLDTNTFLQLTVREMQILVDSRRAFISDGIQIPEVEMFNAILKWNKHDPLIREEHARYLLKHLHYQRVPKATLTGYMITHDLVKGDKELMATIESVLGSDKKRVLDQLRCKGQGVGFGITSIPIASRACIGEDPFSTRATLIVCGGRLYDQMSAQVFQLNEKNNVWKELTRMPTVLSHHCVTVIDNSLYIAGGEDTTIPGSHSVTNFWQYDPPPRNEWTALPDMQQSRSLFFMAEFNDYLYAFGGKSGKIVRNSTERYNLASKRWEFSASLKAPRYAHAGCAFKNTIFISGGIVGKHSTVDMLRLDPMTNHWTAMSPMRCLRSRHSMTSIRDRIYAIGGEDDSLGVSKSCSIALECYTPECNQWFSVAQKIPFQSDGDFGCAHHNGYIFIVGGCKSQLAEHRSDVSCYDPEEDKWEVKVKIPRRLRGAACAVLNFKQV